VILAGLVAGPRPHLSPACCSCVTIIGIPFGIANFKLIPLSLMPLGKEIVPTDRPFATR